MLRFVCFSLLVNYLILEVIVNSATACKLRHFSQIVFNSTSPAYLDRIVSISLADIKALSHTLHRTISSLVLQFFVSLTEPSSIVRMCPVGQTATHAFQPIQLSGARLKGVLTLRATPRLVKFNAETRAVLSVISIMRKRAADVLFCILIQKQ